MGAQGIAVAGRQHNARPAGVLPYPHLRDRAGKTTRGALPAACWRDRPRKDLKNNRATALRATRGVAVPAQPGTNPRHPFRGTRCPRDEGVVGVGHYHSLRRQLLAGVAPALRYLAHLVVAVELVAAQVEQDQHRRAHAGSHLWEPCLVDLEDGGRTRLSSRQRGGQAGRQVGPEEVRNDWALTAATHSAGQQFGRGRLAVGPRDKRYLPARREPLESQRVDRKDGVAPNDRSRTATSGPGESTEASSRHNSEACP